MSWSSAVWLALFDTVGRGLDFVGGLFSRRQADAVEQQATDTEAARAGTAAGAAAHDAGHAVEKGTE